MRADRPSQTAAMVAFMRAIADAGITSVRGFSDPTAQALLPQPWAALYGWLASRLRDASAQRRRQVSGRTDILPLRTMAIDTELRHALAAGCQQVVLLGAGLDGRAHRMRELSDVVLFEVDHPATQRYKRSRVGGLQVFPRELIYVAVDFERETLGERLSQSGHRCDLPTVWIWEGVVMYLSDQALRGTLDSIAERSAPGSVLLVQYSEPNAAARDFRRMRWFTSLVGEPQIGARSQATMAAEVQRVGFTVVGDTNGLDWANQFSAMAPTSDLARTMRLVVAVAGSTAALAESAA